ncbi:hypothetical protein MTO96_044378, partial [Rhipicephalus appendiculatus]
TYMADFIITITSTGWLAYNRFCNAMPPNSIKIDDQGPTVLESHWFVVAASTILSKSSVITGLSFELSALKRLDKKRSASILISLAAPQNYLGDPVYAYGVFSNASKVLTLSEYNDSLATKFLKAVTDFGRLREDTAWLLYNVHNEGPNNTCLEPPFHRPQAL